MWKSANQHTATLQAGRELTDRLIEHGQQEPKGETLEELAATTGHMLADEPDTMSGEAKK